MRVLVTGGGGFLASALLPRLAAREEVFATHRPDAEPPAVEGVQWLAEDLAQPLGERLPASIDAVLHLAQSRRYREFPDGAVDMYEVNAAATVRLLDYALRAGARTFTYASSGSVYARSREPLRETDVPSPPEFYATTKLAGERVVEQFRGELLAHALRPFFIYGPQQPMMMVRGLVTRVQEHQDVTLAGPDGIHVNPVFVDDAADAVIATLGLDESHTVNVAGPDVVSVREIADIAGRVLGETPSFVVGEPQLDLIASVERQSELLGAPKVGFEEGLRRTVDAEARLAARGR
ncbi:MAG TPA: NAD(P)-dependent oxidoreductase [Solirubrobacteraceae bacterium]|jgi:UDP-glucose 4-epimerase|nr:NAD(P)-dependent oxidoreductase [Solirubrobacteraceae bacterium]